MCLKCHWSRAFVESAVQTIGKKLWLVIHSSMQVAEVVAIKSSLQCVQQIKYQISDSLQFQLYNETALKK